jgi:hypothetical protein
MNDDVSWLLDHARAVLDGTVHMPHGQRGRAATHLARQALEELIKRLCQEVGAVMPRATTRSRLIVLRVLALPDCATAAQVAWDGLSRACHRHAYELSPGEAEIRSLLEGVAQLRASSTAIRGSGS